MSALFRLAFLVLLSVSVISVPSCSPYEDGPTVCLMPRKARVTNKWKVQRAETLDGRNATEVYADYRFEFKKDATFTITYSPTTSYSGTWYVEKENLVMAYVEEYNNIKRTTNVTYTIRRLMPNEMTLVYEPYPASVASGPVRLYLVSE